MFYSLEAVFFETVVNYILKPINLIGIVFILGGLLLVIFSRQIAGFFEHKSAADSNDRFAFVTRILGFVFLASGVLVLILS